MTQLICIRKTSAFVGQFPQSKNSVFFTDVKFFALRCSRLLTVLCITKASANLCLDRTTAACMARFKGKVTPSFQKHFPKFQNCNSQSQNLTYRTSPSYQQSSTHQKNVSERYRTQCVYGSEFKIFKFQNVKLGR